jgi:hypothetical protein
LSRTSLLTRRPGRRYWDSIPCHDPFFHFSGKERSSAQTGALQRGVASRSVSRDARSNDLLQRWDGS